MIRLPFHHQINHLGWIAILRRIVEQIRKYLLQSGTVKISVKFAGRFQCELELGMRHLDFFDSRLADGLQVNRLPLDPNTATQLASAVFQEVVHHG